MSHRHAHTFTQVRVGTHSPHTHAHVCSLIHMPTHAWPNPSHPLPLGLDTRLGPGPQLSTLTPAQSLPSTTWQPGVSFPRRRGLCPQFGEGPVTFCLPHIMATAIPSWSPWVLGQLTHRERSSSGSSLGSPQVLQAPWQKSGVSVRNRECCRGGQDCPAPACISSGWACGALVLSLSLLRGKPRPRAAR